MDLLLDTHTLLWWVDDAPQLSAMALPWHHRDPFDRLLIT